MPTTKIISGNPVSIKASITDIPAVMQAITASAIMFNRTGGVNLKADQITVVGDVTERNKIFQINAEAGVTVLVGDLSVKP